MSEYIVNMYSEAAGVKGEEIVRCRDCRYYMDYEHEFEPNLGYCRFHDMEEVRDSRFCAWGKRKEGGE